MRTNPKVRVPKKTPSAKALDRLLGQNELIKELVSSCAEDLSSINVALKEELAQNQRGTGMENAIEKSEAVEEKVQGASEKLSEVNEALENEVKVRGSLEDELIKAKEQGEADRHASLHDLLTGLPNRALFNDRLEHGLAQAERHGWTLAVMFEDLDDFKRINDRFGHDAGDLVVQTIADRLMENTRQDDTVSRHGGDEFLYLLMEIRNERDITLIAEKRIEAIKAPCSVMAGDQKIDLTVNASIGISLFPKNGTTPEALIKKADAAMYASKRNKKWGYSFAP